MEANLTDANDAAKAKEVTMQEELDGLCDKCVEELAKMDDERKMWTSTKMQLDETLLEYSSLAEDEG